QATRSTVRTASLFSPLTKQWTQFLGHLGRILGFAFPDDSHSPAQRPYRSQNLSISLHVAGKLGIPELDARSRCCAVLAASVAMPKTAVNKQGIFQPGKYQVRSTRQVSSVKPESQAELVGDLTDSHFRPRILSPYARHVRAAPASINTVSHRAIHRRVWSF